SQPYSRFSPQFNQANLKAALQASGLRYLYMGDCLGGRPSGAGMYDSGGFVLYSAVAASTRFMQGIERLECGAEDYRVVIMCSEEDPTSCHRHLLVGRVLVTHGHEVIHLRGDGTTETYQQVELRRLPGQMSLLVQEEAPWRSTRSVSPRSPQSSSSDFSDDMESSD
ncbi:MAG: DUF488 domain-containing protein, partial [Actinobacteria bacterium]|nr:DUF488 domain-containing protein [Actinomycetota bacterium]